MKIVGVGCGPGLLTMQAAKIIYEAKRVAGSERALALAEEFIQEGCHVYLLRDNFRLNDFPPDTVVLSTGDPLLAGLGAEGAEYIPGISSLQLAFARLRLPLVGVSVVMGHGKELTARSTEQAVEDAQAGKNVFIVADPKFNVNNLAARLREEGVDCRIAVCQDLGYEGEEILQGTPAEPPEPTSPLFAVVLGRW